MKYESNSIIVEADQFNGKDLPKNGLRDPNTPSVYIENIYGIKEIVEKSDWVVKMPSGMVMRVPDKIFQTMYSTYQEVKIPEQTCLITGDIEGEILGEVSDVEIHRISCKEAMQNILALITKHYVSRSEVVGMLESIPFKDDNIKEIVGCILDIIAKLKEGK